MGIINYIKETRGELRHMNWPTRGQAVAYTFIVIFISVALALFLGAFDFIFSKLLTFII